MNRPLLVSILLLAAPLAAQEAVQPNEHAKSLHRLVGSYSGKGVARAAKGAPEDKWEADLVAKPLFGGLFVHEELEVRFSAPSPMRMSTVWGWDPGRQEMFNASVSNYGGMMRKRLQWADDDTLVAFDLAPAMGNLQVSRATYHFTEDGFTYRVDKASPKGEWFVEVEGEFHRADVQVAVDGPAFVGAPMPKEMVKLQKALAGRFRLEGEMAMPDGSGTMEIGGNEMVMPLFGGQVLVSRAASDPMPGGDVWRGVNAFAWDAERGHYWSLMVDNMGDVAYAPTWWVGDQLVSIEARVSEGLPTVNRTVIHIGEDGMSGFESHVTSGTTAPHRAFKATYKRVER